MTTYKQQLQWKHARPVGATLGAILSTVILFAGLIVTLLIVFSGVSEPTHSLNARLSKQVTVPIVVEATAKTTMDTKVLTVAVSPPPTLRLFKSFPWPIEPLDPKYTKRPLTIESSFQPSVNQPTISAQISSTPQLIIPSINVVQAIMHIPVRNGEWDITELDTGVGHLATTGTAPGDDLAMTFVGHSSVPGPSAGAFANLAQLGHGEQMIYRWNGFDYTYEVTHIMQVTPDQVGALYEENGNMLILATCSGWNSEAGAYLQRLVTQAELVSVTPSP